MDIIRSAQDMQRRALALRREGKRIGLVPTMGYLHEAHLSLVRIARARADVVVVSLFVNPTQFGPGEDFERYPRDFERDERLCRDESVDLLFYPSRDEMYGPDHSLFVVDESCSDRYEGRSRPGHFRGVLTVVAKLFNLTLPDCAVFGQKDAQQLHLVRQMVRQLDFPIEIVAGPIVREPDGLAMSSRNVYLSPEQRRDATCLRRALDRAEERVAAGERSADALRAAVESMVAARPTARLDYVDVVEAMTFQPVRQLEKESLVVLAVYFGKTRLLDNTLIAPPAG